MNNNIVLNQMNPSMGEVANKIIKMMDNEKGIKEIFNGKYSLIYSAEVSAIIEVNVEEIGFVNLRAPHECKTDVGIFHVDMGIKEKYRGRGYSKIVIDELQKNFPEAYFIGETKENNISALKMGKEIASYDDIKILLLGNYNNRKIADFYKGNNSLFDIVNEHFSMESEARKEGISAKQYHMQQVFKR